MVSPVATELSFSTRLWFAWACFFRVLVDGAFAKRAFDAQEAAPALPPPREEPREEPREPAPKVAPAPVVAKAEAPAEKPSANAETGALQLLAALQREGRFVDFLQQDITSFPDGEVGTVARVVHEGCRKALAGHVDVAPVRSEDEGTKVTVAEGTNPAETKLVGNVSGKAPFRGTLVHKGWRATKVSLPVLLPGHDAHVLAPAEVSL
jgi:hypothetical protein